MRRSWMVVTGRMVIWDWPVEFVRRSTGLDWTGPDQAVIRMSRWRLTNNRVSPAHQVSEYASFVSLGTPPADRRRQCCRSGRTATMENYSPTGRPPASACTCSDRVYALGKRTERMHRCTANSTDADFGHIIRSHKRENQH